MADLWEYAALSSHVYSDNPGDDPDQGFFLPEGFSSLASYTGIDGLFARAYVEAASGDIIVAVRGTNFDSLDDWITNVQTALGLNRALGNESQVTDLADFIADLMLDIENSAPGTAQGRVKVTGHSLGGGLAGVMSGLFDIEGVGLDPAPFAKYLSGADTSRFAFKTFLDLALSKLPLDEIEDATAQFASWFGDWVTSTLPPTQEEANYQSRLDSNFSILQMAGDALDALAITDALFAGLSERFSGREEIIYQVTDTSNGTLSGDPIDLHSVDLLALAVKTSSTARGGAGGEWTMRPFDGGQRGDGLIRGNADVHRIILEDKLSLPLAEDGGWTALLRWWASDIELYARNYDMLQLDGTITRGKAGQGFSIDSETDGSLHGALLDLGFSVIRDGLDDGAIEQQARDAWYLDDRNDVVQIDMRQIDIENGPDEQELENGRHSASAVTDLYAWDTIERSFNGGTDMRTAEVVEALFDTTRNDVEEGRATAGNTQVITVQAGEDGVGFTYQLTEDDPNWTVGNLMIGGDGSNDLRGGAGDDILLGGRADDTFTVSAGKDIFVGGGGDDVYIADPDANGIFHIFGQRGSGDTLVFGDAFDGEDFTIDLEKIEDDPFQGITIDTSDAGHFTAYGLTDILLANGTATVTRADELRLNVTVDYAGADAIVNRVKAEGDPGESPDETEAPLIVHNFEVADLDASGLRFLSTDEDFNDGERVNDIITIDGDKQLVGGASFDFDKFDFVYSETFRYKPFADGNGFDGILEEVAVYRGAFSVFAGWAGFGLGVGQAFGAYGIAARNPALAGMGPVLGLSFLAVGVYEYGRMVLSYRDQMDRRYFGIHGEEYILGRLEDDGTRELRIVIDPDDTQARQEILIEGWREGDFGISIKIAERGQGADLADPTERDAVITRDADLTDDNFSDEYIRGVAERQGLVIPDAPTPPGGPLGPDGPSAGPLEPSADGTGIVRNGNASDNEMGGTDGRDLFSGLGGNDTLVGGEGYDTYVFGDGDGQDVIFDLSGEGSLIQFRSGISLDDVTFEDIPGDNGATDRLISYGSGDTILIKNWSDLTPEAQAAWGFEELEGDLPRSDNPEDVPDRATPTPLYDGTAGDDVMLGTDATELFNGGDGNDTIDAQGGSDDIVGGAGDDAILGGAGRDVINAGAGNDTIAGGTGRDQINGGTGDDTYLFELGDGVDTIRDPEGGDEGIFLFGGTPPDSDTLMFGLGIEPADITLTRDPGSPDALTLTIGLTGEQVILADQYEDEHEYGSNGVERVIFADGTEWTRTDMEAIYLNQATTDGDDEIVGSRSAETLDGGTGNDWLNGTGGSDTYLWSRGGGDDRITDYPSDFFLVNSFNRLVLGDGIVAGDISFDRGVTDFDSNDLIITIAGAGGGTITVDRFFLPYGDDPYGSGIEVIVFADGTVFDRDEIYSRWIASRVDEGDNTVYGTPGNDVVDGGAGDDRIEGGDGNDLLIGNAGDDRLGGRFDDNGDDTLIGGAGNDSLSGDDGDDTYIFGADFGTDTMRDFLYGGGGTNSNTVVFTDHVFDDFTFVASGDEGLDLLMTAGDGNSLTIQGFIGRTYFLGSGGWYEDRWLTIDSFTFADGQVVQAEQINLLADISGAVPEGEVGTSGADTMTGTDAEDRLEAGGGNDTLDGGAARDVLFAGAGDDSVIGGDGNDLAVGSDGQDVMIGELGDDLLFGGAGNDDLSGGAGNDYLGGGGGDDLVQAGDGDDSLDGGAGNDTLSGGTGRDALAGDAGDDTYLFNFGDGADVIDARRDDAGETETLILGPGLTKEMIRATFDGFDLILSFANGTTDRITLTGFLADGELSEIRFDNGDTFTGQSFLEYLTGATAGDDVPGGTLTNSSGDVLQYGGRGNDFLTSLNADTIYVFGRGDGQDEMYAHEGSFFSQPYDFVLLIRGYTADEIVLERGGPDNDDLLISFTTGGDTMRVINHFGFAGIYADDTLDAIRFSDGTRWSESRINDEVVGADTNNGSGSDLSETLVSTSADETLSGAGGADTYVWAAGGGTDVLNDASVASDEADVLVFGAGVAPGAVTVSQDGTDIILSLPDGDSLRLVDQLAGDGRGLEQISFTSGDVWTRATIASLLADGLASEGDDLITGGDLAETFSGGAGDDTIEGGAGNDAYVYAAGDGNDTITEIAGEGDDVLTLGAGISSADAVLRRDPTDTDTLLIDLPDGSVITVTDQFAGGGVEQLRFADGTFLGRDAIEIRTAADSQTAGDDVVLGTDEAEVLAGGAGNDTLDGGAGDDFYVFAVGDGADDISDSGGDGSTLVLGLGIDPAAVTAARDGDDLTLVFGDAPGDSIRVVDHFAGQAVTIVQFHDGTLWDQPLIDTLAETGVLIESGLAPLAPNPLGAIDPQGATEDEPFEFDLPGGLFDDLNTVTATLEGGAALPDWLTYTAGQFTGTPGQDDADLLQITLSGTGTDGNPRTETLWLGVVPVNDAPQAAGTLTDAEITQYNTFEIDLSGVAFTDEDHADLFVSLQLANGDPLPSWMSYDASTGLLTGRATGGTVDSFAGFTDYGLQLVAEDDAGAQAVVAFNLRAVPRVTETTRTGTDGNDTLTGTANVDIFEGGLGDDVLRGGGGRDIYIFNPGDGSDRLDTSFYGGNDSIGGVIRFGAGIDPDDLILSREGYTDTTNYDYWRRDLRIDFDGSPDDSILVEEQFAGLDNDASAIIRIEFDDGTAWDFTEIAQRAGGQAGEIIGTAFDDTLAGTAGQDTQFGMLGDDTLEASAGNDRLYGGEGDDVYRWGYGSGHDNLSDLNSDSGSVIISLDRLEFGPGITLDDLTFDVLEGSLSSFSYIGRGGLRIGLKDSPDDTLTITNQYVFQIGRSFAIDTFAFEDGTELTLEELDFAVNPDAVVIGTDGSDALVGTTRGEIIDGGLGNDILQGGRGDDIYLWSLGDGDDRIWESDDRSFDVLSFGEGIGTDDLRLYRPMRNGNELTDLFIEVLPTGETIHLDGQYQVSFEEFAEGSNDERLVLVPLIDEVRFADGTVWNYAYLRDATLTGNDSDQEIIGYEFQDDTVDGGAGNDILNGLGGDDVYIWGPGYGDDQITETGPINIYETDLNTIRLVGAITPQDVTVSREPSPDGDDIWTRLTILTTGETLVITEPFSQGDLAFQIEFQEAGILWDETAVAAVVEATAGTDGDDLFAAGGGVEDVDLGAGDDTAYLDGGATVRGGDGSDTYVNGRFAQENVTIVETAGQAGDIDRLLAPEVRTASQLQVNVASNGRDLLIRWSSFDDPIVLVDAALGQEGVGIEEIVYADDTVQTIAEILALAVPFTGPTLTGTTGAETLTATDGVDTVLDGLAGDDRLVGTDDGADVFVWRSGDGHDVIFDPRGGNYFSDPDMLILEGVAFADVTLGLMGDDLLITLVATGEQITVQDQFSASSSNGARAGIEQIQFTDIRLLNRAEIMEATLVLGSDASDTLVGTSWNETFEGGLGDDVIYSGGSGNDVFGQGSDTYVWSKGQGNDVIVDRDNVATNGGGFTPTTPVTATDTLILTDVLAHEVELSRFATNEMLIRILPTGEFIRVIDQYSTSSSGTRGIERLVFGDGSAIEGQAAFAEVAQYRGTTGNDRVYAGSYDDVLIGFAGNDTLYGGTGNDVYLFNSGDGADLIVESAARVGEDVVRFGAGITEADVTLTRTGDLDNLVITYGAGDVVTVNDHFETAAVEISQIIFDDGTIWDEARILDEINQPGAGDQTITGTMGDDSLTGGGGVDVIRGLAGADTYHYGLGDGDVTITDDGTDEDELDLVQFGPGIAPEDITVTRDGDNIVLSLAGGGTVTLTARLTDVLASADAVRFDDGTYWDFLLLLALSDPNAGNIAPEASDDSFATQADVAITLTLADLTDNDSDADNDVLTLVSVNSVAGGSAEIIEGDVVFTPNAGFVGTGEVLYVISDGRGGFDAARLLIDVGAGNTDPVAGDDTATVAEDGTVLIDVLDNDSDADGDPLTLIDVTGATAGTAVIEDNQIRYTPDADSHGTDTLSYTISDGNGGTVQADVTVTITPENDDPVAVADDLALTAGGSVTADLALNDSDIDGDDLNVTQIDGLVLIPGGAAVIRQGVTITQALDGTISFAAPGDFAGLDAGETADVTLAYTVSDGQGGTAAGSVTITVTGIAQADPVLDGTDGNDVINTSYVDPDGDILTDAGQSIVAGAGNDSVYDGAGADTIFGGEGQDRFFAGDGANAYDGGDGDRDEVLYTRATTGLVIDTTDPGQSTGIAAGDSFAGIERLQGTNYDDTIVASAGMDIQNARRGDDLLIDGAGLTLMRGGDGADTFRLIAGDGETDRISDFTIGEDLIDLSLWGVETLDALSFGPRINGSGAPLDTGLWLRWGPELVQLDGLTMADVPLLTEASFVFGTGGGTFGDGTVDGTGGNDIINATYTDADGDYLTSSGDIIVAGAGADRIYDGAGDDTISGNGGTDRFYGGWGADSYDGGDNRNDEINFQYAAQGLTVDMTDTSNSTFEAAADTYVNIERLRGSNFDDILIAADGVGIYDARAGDDLLVDGGGVTFLKGGAGADVFRLIAGDGARDRINDFTLGEDRLDLSLWGARALSELTIVERTNGAGDPVGGLYLSFRDEEVQIDGLDTGDIGSFADADFIWDMTPFTGDGTVNGTAGDDVIDAGFVDAQGDFITNTGQIVLAGEGSNTVYDGGGDDMLFGGSDYDRFFAGDGADAYDGGAGTRDEVFYLLSDEGLVIDMSDPGQSTGIAAGDSFVGIERIRGTNYDDVITVTGDTSVQDARAGDDLLIDGDGRNTLRGGDGADTFRLIAGDGQEDRISDLSIGEDVIDISAWGASAFDDLTIVGRTSGSGAPLNGIVVSFAGESVILDRLTVDDIPALSGSFVFD